MKKKKDSEKRGQWHRSTLGINKSSMCICTSEESMFLCVLLNFCSFVFCWETSERVRRLARKILAKDLIRWLISSQPSPLHNFKYIHRFKYAYEGFAKSVPTTYSWPYCLCRGYLLSQMLTLGAEPVPEYFGNTHVWNREVLRTSPHPTESLAL